MRCDSSLFKLGPAQYSKKVKYLHFSFLVFSLFFKWDLHPVVEDVVDGFSRKGWHHQRSDNAYEGDEEETYVQMLELAGWSCKQIFDKQDRFVHPAAIARMTRKKVVILLFHNQVEKNNTDL